MSDTGFSGIISVCWRAGKKNFLSASISQFVLTRPAKTMKINFEYGFSIVKNNVREVIIFLQNFKTHHFLL